MKRVFDSFTNRDLWLWMFFWHIFNVILRTMFSDKLHVLKVYVFIYFVSLNGCFTKLFLFYSVIRQFDLVLLFLFHHNFLFPIKLVSVVSKKRPSLRYRAFRLSSFEIRTQGNANRIWFTERNICRRGRGCTCFDEFYIVHFHLWDPFRKLVFNILDPFRGP